MPKMKTHKGAKKRLKVTGTGKVTRKKANAAHILTKKTRKRKRQLKGNAVVSNTDQSRLKRILKLK